MKQKKEVHFNRPQQLSHMIMANFEVAIWGRGTGKSTGLIAPRSIHNLTKMPRSMGVFVAESYIQLLARTLPPVIQGWEELGYKRDRDFSVRRFGPDAWERPMVSPLTAEFMIHWRNGSGISMVSQDRPGSSNGLSIDWVIGDEAKFLDKEKFLQELVPAIRGNEVHFGDYSEHKSILLCSDMPTQASAMWLFDYEKEVDQTLIELIIELNLRISELYQAMEGATFSTRKKYQGQINTMQKQLNVLRRNSVYYSEASTIDNIEVLGEDYIKQQKRTLTPLLYDTSILNKRLKKVASAFYAFYNEQKHTYSKFNYDRVDNLIIDTKFDYAEGLHLDCTTDGDLVENEPLHIALDYNSSIWPLVVGQFIGNTLFVVKSFHRLHPYRLADVVRDFCRYYHHFKNKTVYFHHDATAIQQFNRDASFADEVRLELEQVGWRVILKYQGKPPSHDSKYKMFGNIFAEYSSKYPALKINKPNNPDLLVSIERSKVIQGRNGFQKDKKDERNESIDQSTTTHYSDALDMLVIGIMDLKYGGVNFEQVMIA